MLSRFMGGELTSPASEAAQLSVTPQLIRQVINEVADTRARRLALNEAIVAHEAASLKEPAVRSAAPRLAASRGTSRGSRGGRDGQKVNSADLRIKPLRSTAPARVPRNIRSSVVYDIVKFRQVVTTSTSSGTETNFSFSLSQHPQGATWALLFDQWCIPQVSVSFYDESNTTITPIELHTAIDFDSTGSIGGLIDSYDNASVDVLTNQKVVTRSCHPCNKTRGGTSDSSTVVRTWIDSAAPTNAWYGIRSYCPAIAVAGTMLVEQTIWYAFRGRI